MSRIRTTLFVILILGLMVFGGIMIVKYHNLKIEHLELKLQTRDKIDSIKKEGELLLGTINDLNINLEECNFIIDSLLKSKQEIIMNKEYIISENIIDGVKTLKKNLIWER